MTDRMLHPDFKAAPYWWEAFQPRSFEATPVPEEAHVAIIGGGYTGLAAALELKKHGIDAVVIEAGDFGSGASTRNAGFVGSYGNLSQRYGARRRGFDGATERRRHAEAIDSGLLVERLIAEERIACHWQETGHLIPAWSRGHYAAMAAKVQHLNRYGDWGASLVPPERMHEELGSTYYRGGMFIARTALIHPAIFYGGLLAACERRGVTLCGKARVTLLHRSGSGWKLVTERGSLLARHTIVATNGYTGQVTPQFERRIVPMGSYMIATEELHPTTVKSLIPRGRSVFDSRRVLSYARPSPDGRRLLFGGRVRFSPAAPEETVEPLYRQMIERFPQIDGCRITHGWTGMLAFTFDEASHMGAINGLHYALGCNGSGIAMMTHLGTMVARKIAGVGQPSCFEDGRFPEKFYYSGKPWFVPALGQYFLFRDWLDRRIG